MCRLSAHKIALFKTHLNHSSEYSVCNEQWNDIGKKLNLSAQNDKSLDKLALKNQLLYK